MFYLADKTEHLSSGHSISDSSEKLLRRGKAGANICRSFCNKLDTRNKENATGNLPTFSTGEDGWSLLLHML